MWPPARFAEVGDPCPTHGFVLVMTGSADEAGLVHAVANLMHGGAIDLAGRTGSAHSERSTSTRVLRPATSQWSSRDLPGLSGAGTVRRGLGGRTPRHLGRLPTVKHGSAVASVPSTTGRGASFEPLGSAIMTGRR